MPAAIFERADLVVVNESEAEYYGAALDASDALVAVTRGKAGATLSRRGRKITESAPPSVTAVDSTAAGDAFTAALTIALIEKMTPPDALRFACTAGALATTKPGAQPAVPRRPEIEAMSP